MKIKNKLFYIKDFDEHYTLYVFGKRIVSFRHKCKFQYKPAIEYGLTKEKRSPNLIVSLTSYPERIKTIYKTINTLLTQTTKPDKLILWLADTQFPNFEKDLPRELLNLKELGLEIRWCEDLKSYKKLVPALKEFPDDIIVTADDDILYDSDWLEDLYKSYLENNNFLITNRARLLELKNQEIRIIPRAIVEEIEFIKPSFLNQFYGGAGCLYPPHCLNSDVYDSNKFLKLLPTNDDVYFWAMAVLNKTKILVTEGKNSDLCQIKVSSDRLCDKNEKTKETPFEIMLKAYPKILENIKE